MRKSNECDFWSFVVALWSYWLYCLVNISFRFLYRSLIFYFDNETPKVLMPPLSSKSAPAIKTGSQHDCPFHNLNNDTKNLFTASLQPVYPASQSRLAIGFLLLHASKDSPNHVLFCPYARLGFLSFSMSCTRAARQLRPWHISLLPSWIWKKWALLAHFLHDGFRMVLCGKFAQRLGRYSGRIRINWRSENRCGLPKGSWIAT